MIIDLVAEQLIRIAKCAGDAIIDIYQKEAFDQKIKSDNSPLTEADIASHNIITDGLKHLTPNIPILSEEDNNISWDKRKCWDSYWLIDPLDGTKEFIKKNGEFTVNIALVENHSPMIGVVHAPAIDETCVGVVSKKKAIKISKGEKKIIKTKPHKKGEVWRIVGSRSHAGGSLKQYLKQFDKYELISMGSSIKLCLIAEGSAHIYPRLSPTSEWDTAAAHAVVNASGGKVVNAFDGRTIKYNTKNELLNPYFIVQSE